MAHPPFSFEEYVMRNLFSYLRLLFVIFGWLLVREQPLIFLACMGSALVIGGLNELA
jgi:hypothetical protein